MVRANSILYRPAFLSKIPTSLTIIIVSPVTKRSAQ